MRLRKDRRTAAWACRGRYGEMSGHRRPWSAVLAYLGLRKRMRKLGAR